MNYWVFYNDDYHENGGVGLHKCESEEDAERFIGHRMEMNESSIDSYTVILGKEKFVKAVEVCTRVKIGG